MNDVDKIKTVLRLINQNIQDVTQELIREECLLSSMKIRKEYKDKEDNENFGGGFTQNPYDEQVKRIELCVEDDKKSVQNWKDIYDFTMNVLFEKYFPKS